jgi:hypothetical protein
MKLDHYELIARHDLFSFEFLSEGPKGKVPKMVKFQKMHLPNLYNLAFGDKDPETGQLDHMVVTNNGDTEKVLATVVAVVYAFTEKHPEAWIYATGSTKARTRLYRMGLNKYFDIAQEKFMMFGERQSGGMEFYEKGKDYFAFAVHRKNY